MKEFYFRPRLGMGWFLIKVCMKYGVKLFSSPSGDGLVPVAQYIFDSPIGFRPRLGMGWFPEDIKSKMQYFRPRLGMGWFISISLYVIWFRDFRPRLGMGWFRILKVKKIRLKIFVPAWGWVGSRDSLKLLPFSLFSSPLGDGLVLRTLRPFGKFHGFSSPLGDGLVLCWKLESCWDKGVFVPAWGWVGSGRCYCKSIFSASFRPRLGMGWFLMLMHKKHPSLCFRPRLGMGWFCRF